MCSRIGVSAQVSVVAQSLIPTSSSLGRQSIPRVVFMRKLFCFETGSHSMPLDGAPEQQGIFRLGPVKWVVAQNYF
jgi:hypothetical protein